MPVCSSFNDNFDSTSSAASRAISDLYNAREVIAGGALLALIISFLYMFFVRHFAGFLVWLCILFILIGGFIMSYIFMRYAYTADPNFTPQSQITAYWYTGGFTLGFTVLFLFIIIALRKQIQIAIEVVKESSDTILDIPSLIVFPFFPFGCALVYCGWFIYVCLYLFSVSTPLSYKSSYEYELSHYTFGWGFDKIGRTNDINAQALIRYKVEEDIKRK